MARHIGPKNKLQRAIGEDLGLKTNALKTARRLNIRPGQHGAKGRRKVSNFGEQLKEKQKIKIMYGILEKQLSKLYAIASKNPTATGSALLSLLERRLDNVIFRLGWAPTRAAARQLVSHNHLVINGSKLNIPSYLVNVGDVISLKDKSTKIPVVAELLKEGTTVPEWLKVKGVVAKIERLPERHDVKEPIVEQLVIGFYSR